VKRFIKPVPLTEPLCRPAGACSFQIKCQRFLQQHSGQQKLGDYTDQHYIDMAVLVRRCRMFVPIEFQDDSPAPPRQFKHWSTP
jgi:hypothetical protein